MRKLFIILAAALAAVSCLNTSEKTDRTFETNGTVSAYFKFIRLKEGKIPPHTVMVADLRFEELAIMLSLVGNNIGSIYDVISDPYGDKATAYKETQAKFGDYNPTPSVYRYYEGKKGSGDWILESGYCFYYGFGERVVNISITSTKDWSAEYPAGKELAPLFVADFASLGKYIKGGFTNSEQTLCSCIVSELTQDDLDLMLESDWNIYGGTDLTLTTSTIPENVYEHKITITFTLDTGEQINYTDTLANIIMW